MNPCFSQGGRNDLSVYYGDVFGNATPLTNSDLVITMTLNFLVLLLFYRVLLDKCRVESLR